MFPKDVRFLNLPPNDGPLYLLTTSEQTMRTYACSTAREELHEVFSVACLFAASATYTPKFHARVSHNSPTLFVVLEQERNKLLEVSADTLIEVRSITFDDEIVGVQCSEKLVVVFVRSRHLASAHMYRISADGGLVNCAPVLFAKLELADASCFSLSAEWLAVASRTTGKVSVLSTAAVDVQSAPEVEVSSSDVWLVKLSGGYLVTSDKARLKLKLWRPQEMRGMGDRVAVFRIATDLALAGDQRVLDVAVSANGEFLVATTTSRHCHVFDIAEGKVAVSGGKSSWLNMLQPWDLFTKPAASFVLDGQNAAATIKEVAFDGVGNVHIATNLGSYGVYSVARSAGAVTVQQQPRFTNSIM